MRHQQDLYHNLMWVEGGTSEVNRLNNGVLLLEGVTYIFTTVTITMAFHFQLFRYLNGGAHFLGFCGQENLFTYGNLEKCGIFFNYMANLPVVKRH